MSNNKDLKNKKLDNLKAKKDILNTSIIYNVIIELIASIIVGFVIGNFFDKMFASKPIFLIICLVISLIAAFRMITKEVLKNNGKSP